MRIKRLELKQYEVIRDATLDDLSDVVVIAGPNGVGKTKIKNAICHIFQNGNPPNGCKVELEATNSEESTNWGNSSINLPNQSFWNIFTRGRRKVKTKSCLINIDAARQIESIQFQQYNLNQIGDPTAEEVGYDYSAHRVKDRFADICQTLHREKSKLVTSLGRDAYDQFRSSSATNQVTLSRPTDFTKEFEELFSKLLYPKVMEPIEIGSPTIQYHDVDGNLRNFDELSSGEQAVIVLAFDILLQKPSDSVVLIDEPELHLHPELSFRLLKVLSSIGERNQFFLFTHSTDIIGIGFETGVHFIRPRHTVPTGNQAIKIDHSNLQELNSIPNLREAIGMLSLGKKLLFVEGTGDSIDRNVFATLAKTSKIDLAIVPSDSCDNVNNMASIADTLAKGVFGIELFMVRDRDSLTDSEVGVFAKKSNNRLLFLPCYHIENIFLDSKAIEHIAKKLSASKRPTHLEIEEKLKEFAEQQLNDCVIRYVTSEARFNAGNLDISPKKKLDQSASVDDLKSAINGRKNEMLNETSTIFSDQNIEQRIEYWHAKLSTSIATGWSKDAQSLFYGKSILAQMTNWIFGARKVSIWEEIIKDDSVECLNTIKPLKEILEKI